MTDSPPSQPKQAPSNITSLHPDLEFRASKLRPFDKGALVGFFDLTCRGIVVRDCKLFKKEGREWIGLPSISYQTREGNKVWRDIVEIPDKNDMARFQEAAMRAVRLTNGR